MIDLLVRRHTHSAAPTDPAGERDTGRICDLLAVLGYPTRSDDVERALSEPAVTALVAEIAGAIVGVLVGGARWQR